MPIFKVKEDGNVRTFKVDKAIIHFGRSPKCDITIDQDGVSRLHAKQPRQGICDLEPRQDLRKV